VHDVSPADEERQPPHPALPAPPDPPDEEFGPPLTLDPDAPVPRRPLSPAVLAAVAAGGAVGAPARVGLARLITTGSATGFPWATFVTNVSGSLALGMIMVLFLEHLPHTARTRLLRPFLAAGFCGAFTTFSTMAVEIDLRVRAGYAGTATLYALISVVAGLAAALAGMGLGHLLGSRHPRSPARQGAR
jgi:CrcB protein